jgi:hypothetical protein
MQSRMCRGRSKCPAHRVPRGSKPPSFLLRFTVIREPCRLRNYLPHKSWLSSCLFLVSAHLAVESISSDRCDGRACVHRKRISAIRREAFSSNSSARRARNGGVGIPRRQANPVACEKGQAARGRTAAPGLGARAEGGSRFYAIRRRMLAAHVR